MKQRTITEAIELAKKAREEKGIVPEKIDIEEREVPLWKLYDFSEAVAKQNERKYWNHKQYWKECNQHRPNIGQVVLRDPAAGSVSLAENREKRYKRVEYLIWRFLHPRKSKQINWQ